jgi:hypothetical protein
MGAPQSVLVIGTGTIGEHDDPELGTHHARDAVHLFQTSRLEAIRPYMFEEV